MYLTVRKRIIIPPNIIVKYLVRVYIMREQITVKKQHKGNEL